MELWSMKSSKTKCFVLFFENVWCQTLHWSRRPVHRSEKLRWMCALTPNRRTRFMSTSAHQTGEAERHTLTAVLHFLTRICDGELCVCQTLHRCSAFSPTPLRNQMNFPLRWPTFSTSSRKQTMVRPDTTLMLTLKFSFICWRTCFAFHVSRLVFVYFCTPGWMMGERLHDGERGWFPSRLVEEIQNKAVRAQNLREAFRIQLAQEGGGSSQTGGRTGLRNARRTPKASNFSSPWIDQTGQSGDMKQQQWWGSGTRDKRNQHFEVNDKDTGYEVISPWFGPSSGFVEVCGICCCGLRDLRQMIKLTERACPITQVCYRSVSLVCTAWSKLCVWFGADSL